MSMVVLQAAISFIVLFDSGMIILIDVSDMTFPLLMLLKLSAISCLSEE